MLNRLREWWEGLGRNNQITIVASTLGVMVALIGFVTWANTPEYVPLFSDLSAQDAGEISDKLREQNVKYRFSDSGKSIEVPSGMRDELRMRLVRDGLPHGSNAKLQQDDPIKSGSPFMTKSQEDRMLLQGQENQVARSIMSFQQIENAIVHFAPGNDSPFVADKAAPTASVVVTLRPGQSLTRENVQSIVRLTQMAYSGLTENHISLVDSQGNLLHNPDRADQPDVKTRLNEEREVAQEYRQRIQGMFDNSLGPNKVIVSVNVELNSDQETVKEQISEPGALIKSDTSTETMEGAGAAARAPGTNANVAAGAPTYDATAQNSGAGKFESNRKTAEYAPNLKTVETKKAPGSIRKLTVSLFIDAKVPADLINSFKQNIQTLIGAAAADDPNRQVAIAQVPFDRTEQEAQAKATAAAKSAESMSRVVSIAVPLALMFFCFWLLSRALRRPMPALGGGQQLALEGAGGVGLALDSAEPMLMTAPDGTQYAVTEDGQIVAPGDKEFQIVGIPTGDGSPKTFELIEEAFDSNLESITHMAKSKPETVAALIKSWTAEE